MLKSIKLVARVVASLGWFQESTAAPFLFLSLACDSHFDLSPSLSHTAVLSLSEAAFPFPLLFIDHFSAVFFSSLCLLEPVS